jgi:hypothetical protein
MRDTQVIARPQARPRRRAQPEREIQRAVFAHLRQRGKSGIVFWHPFSGGYRRPKEAAIYKGLGAVAGLPDVMVYGRTDTGDEHGHLFAIELKASDGRPTEQQLAMLDALSNAGAFTAICYDIDSAIRCLEAWNLLRGVSS